MSERWTHLELVCDDPTCCGASLAEFKEKLEGWFKRAAEGVGQSAGPVTVCEGYYDVGADYTWEIPPLPPGPNKCFFAQCDFT